MSHVITQGQTTSFSFLLQRHKTERLCFGSQCDGLGNKATILDRALPFPVWAGRGKQKKSPQGQSLGLTPRSVRLAGLSLLTGQLLEKGSAQAGP